LEIKRREVERARRRAAELLREAGIIVTPAERERIEVADLGLGDLEHTGAQLLTYVNSDRYCAKEIILFPRQTCPEHRHPDTPHGPGKMETFRCRWGEVWLYVDGAPAPAPRASVPRGSEPYYTVFHEIALQPGDQHTIPPGTRHWFQAGEQGAIISEFSSTSRDELDLFTDPRIVRTPTIEEES